MKLKIKTSLSCNKGSIWHLILEGPGFDSLVLNRHHSSQWSLRGDKNEGDENLLSSSVRASLLVCKTNKHPEALIYLVWYTWKQRSTKLECSNKNYFIPMHCSGVHIFWRNRKRNWLSLPHLKFIAQDGNFPFHLPI